MLALVLLASGPFLGDCVARLTVCGKNALAPIRGSTVHNDHVAEKKAAQWLHGIGYHVPTCIREGNSQARPALDVGSRWIAGWQLKKEKRQLGWFWKY